jgi:hypothetical protein
VCDKMLEDDLYSVGDDGKLYCVQDAGFNKTWKTPT